MSDSPQHALVASGGFAVPLPPIYGIPEFGAGLEPVDEWDRVIWRLEDARSEDADTPEGFFFEARFSEPCLTAGWD